MESWRARLRLAVERDGRKHAAIAWQAGIAPETLSRVLNGEHKRPQFGTIVRIAHAAGETIGWVLKEHGFDFSASEQARLLEAAEIVMKHSGWGLKPGDEAQLMRMLARLPE
jgi:DNA-binding phage protein